MKRALPVFPGWKQSSSQLGFTEDDAIATVRDSAAGRSGDGAERLGELTPGSEPRVVKPPVAGDRRRKSFPRVFHDKFRPEGHYAQEASPWRQGKHFHAPALAGRSFR